MIIGFGLAAYSIVANDAIQTLGTFLSSNSRRPWWVLWIYACVVLSAVTIFGWVTHNGDMAYGRLEKFPLPENFDWFYVIPPIVLMILTRFGLPVSTTFLILTVFKPKNLGSMATKSGIGYVVAFFLALLVYRFVMKKAELHFIKTAKDPPSAKWVALQWISTAFLWSQWLIQDLANIYVYLPRKVDAAGMLMSLTAMIALHGVIFYFRGGSIQQIVTSKTNTGDIRAATIVDFLFGIILLVFKEASKMPMSTTWVFIGLLAGREIAISMITNQRTFKEARNIILKDILKAGIALAVSVAMALTLQQVR